MIPSLTPSFTLRLILVLNENASGFIFGKTSKDGAKSYFSIAVNHADQQLMFIHQGRGSEVNYVTAISASITDGKQHSVVIVVDGQIIKVTIDGEDSYGFLSNAIQDCPEDTNDCIVTLAGSTSGAGFNSNVKIAYCFETLIF